jgi:hypothetical protein
MGCIESYCGGPSDSFYEELADYARAQHVISMEDTDCKLALLGKVAVKTNGSMNIVDPSNLSSEFKSILANRVVATNVTVTLIVNKRYMYVREDKEVVAKVFAGRSGVGKSADEIEANRRSVVS